MAKAAPMMTSVHHAPAWPTTSPSRRKTTTPKMVDVHGTKTPRKVPSPPPPSSDIRSARSESGNGMSPVAPTACIWRSDARRL